MIAGVLWLVAFLVLFIRELRAADKLERRIHGEALAIAYPLVLVLLMTLALMELAVGLKFEDYLVVHARLDFRTALLSDRSGHRTATLCMKHVLRELRAARGRCAGKRS